MYFGVAVVLAACTPQEQPNNEPAVDSTVVKAANVADLHGSETPGVEKIYFPSLDSVDICANLYHIDNNAPVIVLCHQARFNKFEYEGIAQELNALGFNCLAIDQRSGGPIANQVNETTLNAIEAGKPVDFLDAEQDMQAAIAYAANRYNHPVILWGSSYSSTLALYIGLENDNVMAVVSFSPGNYFADAKGSLIEMLPGIEKPLFVTSSKNEAPGIVELFSKVELKENQVLFAPEGGGHHGSRALWKNQSDGEEYWAAMKAFLEVVKDTPL